MKKLLSIILLCLSTTVYSEIYQKFEGSEVACYSNDGRFGVNVIFELDEETFTVSPKIQVSVNNQSSEWYFATRSQRVKDEGVYETRFNGFINDRSVLVYLEPVTLYSPSYSEGVLSGINLFSVLYEAKKNGDMIELSTCERLPKLIKAFK